MRKVEAFGIIPVRHIGDTLEVLLIQNRHGQHWGFPKGRAEIDELPYVTAQRELLEETGLQVEHPMAHDPLIDHYITTDPVQGDEVSKSVHYFIATVTGKLLLQSEEILAAQWLSFDLALKQITFPGCRHICIQAREILCA